jgi:ATP-binding cassette subfamily B protein
MVNAANIAGPYLLRMLIDKGILSLSMEWVWKTVAGLFLVAVAKGVFNFTQGYLSEYAAQGVAYELRNAIFEKLNKLSFSYHDQAQTGKLMTRMTSDVEQVRSFISQGLIQLISAIALLIGTVIMLFNMSWQLTLVALIFVPITIGIMSYFIRNVMPIAMRVQKLFGQLNTIMQENLAGIRIVKAFSREEYELNRYRAQNEILLNENLVFIQKITALIPLVFFVGNLAVVGILAFGGYQVIGKQLTLGELVAFLGYNSFLLMPIFMMGMIGAVLSRAEVSAQRIFEVLDAQVEVKNSPDAIVLPRLKGDVTFDDVSFRYFKGGEDVLSHVSFSVKAGQLVAILGKTGSGKSTIYKPIRVFMMLAREECWLMVLMCARLL